MYYVNGCHSEIFCRYTLSTGVVREVQNTEYRIQTETETETETQTQTQTQLGSTILQTDTIKEYYNSMILIIDLLRRFHNKTLYMIILCRSFPYLEGDQEA